MLNLISRFYSKLLTGKNSADVRSILESLVSHGAPEKILVDGKPHLGTDKLIVILRNIRAFLVQQGKAEVFDNEMINRKTESKKIMK